MNNMWIYWREECSYCINRKNCQYKDKMIEFKNKLHNLEKETKGIYGSLKFNCDYFMVDEEKYWNDNIGEQGGK